MDTPQPGKRGVIAVVVRESRFLVIRRSQLVVAPGAYCFPGGGIEPGETEQQALLRELREELAADVRPIRRLWESVTPWRVSLAWWLAELDGEAPLLPHPDEVESFHWFTAAEMRALPELLTSNLAFLTAADAGEFRLD